MLSHTITSTASPLNLQSSYLRIALFLSNNLFDLHIELLFTRITITKFITWSLGRSTFGSHSYS